MPEEFATPTETTSPSQEKSFGWVKVILASIVGLILLAVSVYGGYWYGIQSAKVRVPSAEPQPKTQNQQAAQPTPQPTSPTSAPTEPTDQVDEAAGWEVYTNTEYGYLF